jgi:hypothetical protein
MPVRFSAVWREGTGGQLVLPGGSLEDLKTNDTAAQAQGLRMATLQPFTSAGELLFAALWREGTGGQIVLPGGTLDNLKTQDAALQQQGLRMVSLRPFTSAGQSLFAAVWREGNGNQVVLPGGTLDDLKTNDAAYQAQGLRLVSVQPVVSAGQLLFAAVWRDGSDTAMVLPGGTLDELKANDATFQQQGLRLVGLQPCSINGQLLFTALWRQGTGMQVALPAGTVEDLRTCDATYQQQNLRMEALGVGDAGLAFALSLALHIRILSQPSFDVQTMVENMQQLYASAADIGVEVRSSMQLNRPDLLDVDVGDCDPGQLTAAQQQVFALRQGLGARDIIAYFVRTTVPPLNGCAAHPPTAPGAVIGEGASAWTLAHEIGHVLDLQHVNDNQRLMTGNGTGNIVGMPILIPSEVATMQASPYLIKNT